MVPKHAHRNSEDPDHTSPRGLRRKRKVCQFIYKNIVKTMLFSGINFYIHKKNIVLFYTNVKPASDPDHVTATFPNFKIVQGKRWPNIGLTL